MKNILESPEVFNAFAMIDLAYFNLQKLNEEWATKFTKDGLSMEIHRVTGYGEHMNREYVESTIAPTHRFMQGNQTFDKALFLAVVAVIDRLYLFVHLF